MSAQMAAMVATPNVVTDNSWYPDSSATNHCTANPNNLIIRDTYIGNDQIHMGDGIGLAIQHIASIQEALQQDHWKVAMVEEYSTLVKNKTWSLVPLPPNRRIIGYKWVFKVKENPDGGILKHKARLVAKGFFQLAVYVDDILVTRSSKVEIQALVQQLNTRFALKDLGEDDHFLGIQDWASNPNDRRSTIDFCLYLGSNLISWNSKKQNIISRSNTEAEYRNLATLAAEVTWIQFLLTELQIPQGHVPVLWCDNLSTVLMSTNPILHARTKHIALDLYFVCEKVMKKERAEY
ncbi:Retrovirus-related Pol polyprotein from transposon RE2 [Vitis vinifera]|uniref:Retrovirus-related Pol polyprotein from transposon RE2 n=1 Tax=Vitis vinifera TaxID=29760 RepID=A0A438EIB8_VITVI|nr:Retrovirus-related Pol polyprotein from transposon RE2 [Vitis vinifera]